MTQSMSPWVSLPGALGPEEIVGGIETAAVRCGRTRTNVQQPAAAAGEDEKAVLRDTVGEVRAYGDRFAFILSAKRAVGEHQFQPGAYAPGRTLRKHGLAHSMPPMTTRSTSGAVA